MRFRRLRLFLRVLRYTLLGLVVAVFLLLAISFASLPSTGKLKQPDVSSSWGVLDHSGRLLGFFAADGSSRFWLGIDRIPQQFLRLVVFLEDANFWNHRGIDIRQIYYALLENVAFGSIKYGASTITQQLAKNAYLTRSKTVFRKIKELMLALRLENRLSKQQILEWYLNIVEMAPGVYGLRAGSRYHFGQEPHTLSFPRLLYLASLLPAPRRFTAHPALLQQKIRRVSKRLRHFGRINAGQHNAVINNKDTPLGQPFPRLFPGLTRLLQRLCCPPEATTAQTTLLQTTIEPEAQRQLEQYAASAQKGQGGARLLLLTRNSRVVAALLLPKSQTALNAAPLSLQQGYQIERRALAGFDRLSLIPSRTTRAIQFTRPLRFLASFKQHIKKLPK